MDLAFALLSLSPFAVAPSQVPRREAVDLVEDEQALVTTRAVFVGRVLGQACRGVRGAVVVTSAGGQALTAADGSFELKVDVPLDAECVDVTAVADGDVARGSLLASARVVPPSLSPITYVGTLVLTPISSCPSKWLPTFGGTPSVVSHLHEVRALTVFDDDGGDGGDGPALYVGGTFLSVGGVMAANVTRWNGSRWSRLGSGVSSPTGFPSVDAFTVFDDGSGPALYVGGNFSNAGGVPARCIARWDGSTWSVLGSGLDDIPSIVYALAVFDDGNGPALYAGGYFTSAGGVPVSSIARWDGSTWSGLGSGVATSSLSPGFVHALAVFDDGNGPALYAGGAFSSAGGVPVSSIARWDGSTWTALGSGVDGGIRALIAFDDGSGPALFTGGGFTTAGGVSANRVAKWDGSSWAPLGGGMNSSVRELEVLDDGGGRALHASGDFTVAGGLAAGGHIAKWDGIGWSAQVGGPDDIVNALAVLDAGAGPDLYAGGLFDFADGVLAERIARFDGSSWSALDSGLDGPVASLAVLDPGGGDELFAGGSFTSAGGLLLNRIARWDGSDWSALGSGLDGAVGALAFFDDGGGPALHAGGSFASAGGAPASRIARWNGSSWSALGSGLNGPVHALAVFDDGSGSALYAGGAFTSAGGVAANRIAKWDGSSWSALGSGLNGGLNPEVLALAVFDDGSGPALCVGGLFTTAGGLPARRIARWNGSSWSTFGATLFGGAIEALTVLDEGAGPALFAGGRFTNAGGVVLNRIARWDGSSWSALGSGMNAAVLALTAFDDGSGMALQAGGAFSSAGGVAASSVARWDGSSWTTLGGGVSAPFGSRSVHALTVFDDGSGPALCVGGDFPISPGRDSFLARWGCGRRLAHEQR